MTATEALPAAIHQALRLRETSLAAALICHMAASDPEGAARIRDAITRTEARLRAERGALEARDWRDHIDEQNREWWSE